LVEKYINEHATKRVKAETVQFYEQRVAAIFQKIGDRKVGELTQDMLHLYVDQRCQDINPITGKYISDSTIRRELNLMSMSFNKAISRWGLEAKAPFTGFKNPVKVAVRERHVTDDEWNLISNALFARVKRIVDFGLLTGLREENLLGLRRAWVDFENRLIRIPGEEHKNGRRRKAFLW
jgi:integrase